MTRVCHVSPVHSYQDNRVLEKECAALAQAGYEVFWVVRYDPLQPLPKGTTLDLGRVLTDGPSEIKIVPLSLIKSRFRRWLFTGWQALYRALQCDAAVYHFHDLEFMPQALILRLLGKRVIYDIHEDHVTSLRHKHYMPKLLGRLLGNVLGLVEQWCSGCFETIIAERYYAKRFPKATAILNYPVSRSTQTRVSRSESDLIYTGSVTEARGARIHASIPQLVDGVRVHFIGHCPKQLHHELTRGNACADGLEFSGVGSFVPFQTITEQYQNQPWLAGLAIFPPTENYREKELTKLFEYMQYGIPIIASDFPNWMRLVEGNGCGICVNAKDPEQIREAILQLRNDPKLWREMSQAGFAAAQKYAWSSQSERLLHLYARLVKAPAPSAVEASQVLTRKRESGLTRG